MCSKRKINPYLLNVTLASALPELNYNFMVPKTFFYLSNILKFCREIKKVPIREGRNSINKKNEIYYYVYSFFLFSRLPD